MEASLDEVGANRFAKEDALKNAIKTR